MEAGNTFDKTHSTESRRVRKFLRGRNVGSTRLHEVVTTLKRIMKARVEKKERAGNMLSNFKMLYKKVRSGVWEK